MFWLVVKDRAENKPRVGVLLTEEELARLMKEGIAIESSMVDNAAMMSTLGVIAREYSQQLTMRKSLQLHSARIIYIPHASSVAADFVLEGLFRGCLSLIITDEGIPAARTGWAMSAVSCISVVADEAAERKLVRDISDRAIIDKDGNVFPTFGLN